MGIGEASRDRKPTVMDSVLYSLAQAMAELATVMTTIQHAKWNFGLYSVSIDINKSSLKAEGKTEWKAIEQLVRIWRNTEGE